MHMKYKVSFSCIYASLPKLKGGSKRRVTCNLPTRKDIEVITFETAGEMKEVQKKCTRLHD